MRCKNCKEKFTPRFSTLEKYCWSPDCKTIEAMEKLDKVKKDKQKAWKKKKKVLKEKIKTRSDWMNEAQKEFNRYIRLRDKNMPCISCDSILSGKFDAGHYRSVGGNPELRFNENNCFGQCVACNQHKHGNLIMYRKNLVEKIGIDKVEQLECVNEPLKLTIEEIKDLKEKYKQKANELK